MQQSTVSPPSAPQEMSASAAEAEEPKTAGWWEDERGNLQFVNFVVKRPCCSCCSVLVLCLIMTISLSLIIAQDGNFITDDENDYDLYDTRSKDYDSLRLAKELVEKQRDERENDGLIELNQSKTLDIVYWIYEAETDGGMFTRKALQDMKEADGIMLDNVEWDKYCVLNHANPDDITCKKPMTATTIFYPESWDSVMAQGVVDRLKVPENVELFNTVAPCLQVANTGDSNDDLAAFCATVLQSVSEEQIAASRQLATDIAAITSQWTGEGELVEDPTEVATFCAYLKLLPTVAWQVDFYFDKNFGVDNPVSKFSRTIIEFGGPLAGYNRLEEKKSEQEDTLKQWVLDNLYADMEKVSRKPHSSETNAYYFMGALIFDVFLEILLQDALKAIASVLMVYGYLWWMLGSLFLASVGMAEILLSLPCAWFLFRAIFQIGYFSSLNALTVFIVCAIGADDIFVFMDAYKQSAHAGPHVNRDLATRMSWVWRKSGSAMAITSATTCLAFLCTLFTPIASTRSFGIFAALVVLWDFVLVMTLFCTAVIIYHNRFERAPACTVPFLCGCCTANCECGNQQPSPTESALSSFHDGVDVPQDRVTKFFSQQVSDFVLSVRGRVIIAIVLVAWLVPAVIFVTKLEATKTAEQFLNEDHPLQYSITILNDEFPVSTQDEGLPIYFVWGVDTLDQGGVNQLIDPDFIGEPVFKEEFQFTPECQSKIVEVCNDLQFTLTENRTSLIKQDDTGFSIVRCVMRSFQDFAAAEGYTAGSADDTVPLANVNAAVKAYMANPPEQYEDIQQIAENFGWDGERLRYVAIEVESQALNEFSKLPEAETRAEYDAFVELAAHLDRVVGSSCGASGVLMTDMEQKFIFMNNQKIYRVSAIQGAVIGVAIAFAVLLVATRSLLLASLSTLSILCTIMSVIGAVVMMGWTLGTIEAILISILAGFSVDYVVHLAHAYSHSSGTAAERVRHAFGEMGTPVLSGMLTSVLASLPLFTCQIVFFAKFGTFLCFTILCSWVFANFGFMALIATVGSSSSSSPPPDHGASSATKQPAEVEMSAPLSTVGQAVFSSANPV